MNAAEFRCLLEAMTKETGDRTGYTFVKPRQAQPPEGAHPHHNHDQGEQEQQHDDPPEVILKSALFSKIVSPYAGEDRILRLCARVFARERSRRERGLASIVGSETLADVSVSAAVAAAAAAAMAVDASSPRGGLEGGGGGPGPVMIGAGGEDGLLVQQRDSDTYFCVEETQPRTCWRGVSFVSCIFFFLMHAQST